MNKFILILAFSGSWLLAAGQSNFVKIYYPKINDAELAITREDFRQAAALYKEAFSSVKSPFAKDLFNAFVCKVLLNDFEGSKPYLVKLAQKGIDPLTLEKKDIFYTLKSKPEWENFKISYQQIFDSRPAGETKEIVLEFVAAYYAEIDSVFENREYVVEENNKLVHYRKDRKIRERPKPDSTVTFPLTTRMFVNLQPELDSVDVRYYRKFEDFLKTHPWPGQDELGINNNDLSFGMTPLDYVLHNQQKTFSFSSSSMTVKSEKKTNSAFFLEKLKEAVAEGLMSPEQASLLRRDPPALIEVFKANVENNSGCKDFPDISDKIDRWLVKKRVLTENEKEFYTIIKREFYMPDLNDIYQKYHYQAIKNKYFILPQRIMREEATVPSCEAAQKMLKEAHFIDEN